MREKNTLEVVYTWPESGKEEVRYRAHRDSEEAKDFIAQIANMRKPHCYSIRYTDYQL